MKALRHRLMLTQSEVAERAGLSMYTVHAAEGGRGVSPKTGRALAAALDVAPDELLEEITAPKVERRSQPEARPEERRSLSGLEAMTETLLDQQEENLQAAKQSDLSLERAEKIASDAEATFDFVFKVYRRLDPEGREADELDPDTAALLTAFEEFCDSVSEVLQAAAKKESKATERKRLHDKAIEWKNAA